VPGLNRDRADIIAAGAIVVAEVVPRLGVASARVGPGAARGLFYPFLLPDAPDHLLDDVRTFSVLNLMRQYHDDPAHNGHVRALALALFDGLRPWHPSARPSASCSGTRPGSTTSAWRSTTTATSTTAWR
jgi:exopolyphosphatase / guanosine-5'-triphosphate,3'-diphosphate pyrophosphatase